MAAGATLLVPSGIILRATGNVTINGMVVVQVGAQTSASASAGVAMAAAGSPNGGIGLNGTQAAMLPLGVLGGGSGARSIAVSSGAGGGQVTILSGGIFTLGATGTINANAQAGIVPPPATWAGVAGTAW